MTAQILVVDDEKGLTDVLADLLESEGYEVDVCHDAVSAREKLAAKRFDAAMLDVFLSNSPAGLDLANLIFAEHPTTGVIIMTGYADRADVNLACSNGAFTCIDKPFNLDDVIKALDLALTTNADSDGEN